MLWQLGRVREITSNYNSNTYFYEIWFAWLKILVTNEPIHYKPKAKVLRLQKLINYTFKVHIN